VIKFHPITTSGVGAVAVAFTRILDRQTHRQRDRSIAQCPSPFHGRGIKIVNLVLHSVDQPCSPTNVIGPNPKAK